MHTTDIESYIPQRPPILMVDAFDCDGVGGCTSSLLVREENIFLDDDRRMMAEGLLEHIAQTAAAYVGYCRKMAGDEVNLGYIGDIKRCSVGTHMPSVGKTVCTTMKVVSQVGNITMVAAESTSDGETLISCRMKLAN